MQTISDHPALISSSGFGAYIHWPFCAAKCPYCDFNSHVAKAPLNEERFLAAYTSEIKYWADRLGDNVPPLGSVFFGGGTPSLMSPSLVAGIIEVLGSNFGFLPGAEITLEANPASVDARNFRALSLAGVNRLSLGVQSFDDQALKTLGRLHSGDEARRAIETASENFSRFSFDLIYARPGQSLEHWQGELEEAFRFGARHLSLYQLTIEPNTPYQQLYDAGKLVLPEEELAADFYELTQSLCGAAGLPAYEVSNHAAVGEEARHNLLYWRYGDFLGIGPGAHGRVTLNGQRFATLTRKMPFEWLDLVEAAGCGLLPVDMLDRQTQAVEMLLMGLRLRGGVSLSELEARTGFTVRAAALAALELDELILPRPAGGEFAGNDWQIAPSDKGMALNNHLALKIAEGLVVCDEAF